MLTFIEAAIATTGEAADDVPAPTRQRQVRHLAAEIDALRWQEAGACRDADLRLFFSPDGGEDSGVEPAAERRRRLRKAIRVCEQCPVRQLCRSYALEHGEKFGVWGGLTETERRRIRSQAHERAQGVEQFGEAA
jgi:WhiB family redox-sensing transcriptional regulator